MANSGLEATFLANREALLRFLRARGAPEPEDLLQELWFRSVETAAGPIADPLAYLFRSANNLMLDRVRSELGRGRREEDWADNERAGLGDASPAPSQERALLAREQLRAAEAVLLQLGERTDTIFRMFRLDGISQAEIAVEFGISVSGVEKHLQRAYRALAEFRRQSNAE